MNKIPIFQPVFGDDWKLLPKVMLDHYANRAHTSDRVTINGQMKIELSFLAKLFSPLMRITNTLPPYSGDQIPVTVLFESEPDSNAFCFNRTFYYKNYPEYHFNSRMIPCGQNQVIDYISNNIGWYAAYVVKGQTIKLNHLGYKIRLFGMVFSLPLEWILGRGHAEEEALSDDRFRMVMDIRHPLFGKIYSYSGEFLITEVALND